jgi:hypothetical protein
VLTGLLGQLSKLLDRRFVLNAFFPSLALSAAGLAVYLAGSGGGIGPAIDHWTNRPAGTQVLLVLIAMAWTFFLGTVIANQWTNITRIYEGYLGLPRWLAELGSQWHETKRRKIQRDRNYNLLYLSYPLPSHPARPTALGNILSSGETYASDRYGIEVTVLWQRLYPLLPDDFVLILADARASYEFGLVISCLAAVFALGSFVYLLAVVAPLELCLGCYFGSFLLSYIAYRSSLSPAVVYSENVKAGVDLYRFKLLEQMRIEPPDDHDAEKQLWREISDFLYRNYSPHYKYDSRPG